MLCLTLCVLCLKKSKVRKKAFVIKPMIFSEVYSRAQVDLIDIQNQPDGDLNWILVPQDHLTKFVQLRPVKSKLASEIGYQLLDIFSIFGAPNILQSDNGRELVNSVITKLSEEMWVGLKLVHGNTRHSQRQGSVERTNRDIEVIPLSANPTKWSNTPKKFVGNLPTNCLSVFDHFVIL